MTANIRDRAEDTMETHHTESNEERRLEYRIEIDAEPEAVWRALTDGRELARWFPFQARVQPGEGGSIWMSWDGSWEGENQILVWQEDEHLRTSWAEGATATPLLVDFFLAAESGGTVLRLVHHGFGADDDWDEMYDGIRRGWSFELRVLRHYLEHHRGVDRKVATARVPLPADMGSTEGWRRLVSESVFHLGLDGDRGSVEVAGDRFSGRLLHHEVPGEAALFVDDPNRAILRLMVERCGGPEAPTEAMAWLETWGVDEARVDALSRRWTTVLQEAFGDN